jgi:hypothetical protein
MKKKGFIVLLAAVFHYASPSYGSDSTFYFDLGAFKKVEGSAKELSHWSGHCSTGPRGKEYCSISVVGFECRPKGGSKINHVSSFASYEDSFFFKLLGPIDFKKRNIDFTIVLSGDELTCFIQGDHFGQQKPNLKCTGLDAKKNAILVEIIPKKSTIVGLCGDLVFEGRD